MLNTKVSIEERVILREFSEKGINVFIKRDDLIHPFISGNKWRKLKYNYLTYLKSDYKGIVTFGGAFSNHVLATACFCALYGINSIGIIRGEQPKDSNHILLLAQLWGMKLIFLTRGDYQNKSIHHSEWEKKGYFVIPEGGENEDGIRGCEEIITELTGNYDHIFCASGTGCTIKGILRASLSLNLDTHCHSVPVLKLGESLNNKIINIYDKNKFTIHPNYHFGGYAKTNNELLMFLKKFTTKTGILIDPVYTAKMFFALTDLINSNFFKEGESILAIHTGGLMGLMSEKMRISVQNSIK